MELWLVDENAALVEAWETVFALLPNVSVRHGDILSLAEDAIVSPANSFGHMDGGIDLAYLNHFGLEMQNRLFAAIGDLPNKLLPVGSALIVETGDKRVPWLVSAPTMETPGPVPPSNAFFAMAAALNAARAHGRPIGKLFCPGLATGIGHVPPTEAAKEMAAAYRKWLRGPPDRR